MCSQININKSEESPMDTKRFPSACSGPCHHSIWAPLGSAVLHLCSQSRVRVAVRSMVECVGQVPLLCVTLHHFCLQAAQFGPKAYNGFHPNSLQEEHPAVTFFTECQTDFLALLGKTTVSSAIHLPSRVHGSLFCSTVLLLQAKPPTMLT